MKKHQTEIRWQLTIFGIYILLGLIQSYSEHPEKGIFIHEVIGVVAVVLSNAFLVNFLGNWVMLKHPFSKQPGPFLFWLFATLILFMFYRYLTAYPDHVDILKSYNGNQDKNSLVFFFFISTINFVMCFLVAIGLYSIKKSIRIEKRAIVLQQKVNEAQLQTLKYQINPHFLYNTLSYMYAQARPVSENLSKSILILSDLMRYSLDKTENSNFVPLEHEIRYIENFIEIHQLRFENNFFVNFEIEGVLGNKSIAPMVLITFVENAIKHGKLNDKNHPINILLRVESQKLSFSVENAIQPGKKDHTSGIGLENTRRRLKLLYHKKHHLTVDQKDDTFVVNLQIDFSA